MAIARSAHPRQTLRQASGRPANAPGRLEVPDGLHTSAGVAQRKASRGGTEPPEAGVRRGLAQHGVGNRHHLHPNPRRVAVPVGGARSVLTPDRRLVDGGQITRDLAIGTLLMAVWRRKPVQEVLVHVAQGSQFSSHDWQDFLKAHRLKPSMSRRGNCHDNAVVESFFQLLKRERIKPRIYPTRDEMTPVRMCSITLSCSTTRIAGTTTTTNCRRSSTNGGIF